MDRARVGKTYLPREAVGGGPSAQRREEPMVEGAGGGDEACPLHTPLCGGRSPSHRFAGEVGFVHFCSKN